MLVCNKPTRTRGAFYSSLPSVQIKWTKLQMWNLLETSGSQSSSCHGSLHRHKLDLKLPFDKILSLVLIKYCLFHDRKTVKPTTNIQLTFWHMLCLSSRSASSEGPGTLWSTKASPSETLLTSSAVVKWDGLVFGAFPGCVTRCFTLTSRFAKVTICATQCRHFLSFFLLLSGVLRMLGYVRPWRLVAVHLTKRGKRRSIWRSLQIGTAFTRRCDVIGLQMLLWRMQTLNWDTAIEFYID